VGPPTERTEDIPRYTHYAMYTSFCVCHSHSPLVPWFAPIQHSREVFGKLSRTAEIFHELSPTEHAQLWVVAGYVLPSTHQFLFRAAELSTLQSPAHSCFSPITGIVNPI